jgi:hypothetical protein
MGRTDGNTNLAITWPARPADTKHAMALHDVSPGIVGRNVAAREGD